MPTILFAQLPGLGPLSGMIAGWMADAVKSFYGMAAEACVWVVGRVGEAIAATTVPNLQQSFFVAMQHRTIIYVAAVAVALAMFAMIEAAVAGHGRGFAIVMPLVKLLRWVVMAFLIVPLAAAGLAVVYEAIAWIGGGVGVDLTTSLTALFAATAETGAQAGADLNPGAAGGGLVGGLLLLGLILALLLLVLAVGIWVVMFALSAAIYLLAIVLIVMMAASIWPRTRTSAVKATRALTSVIIAPLFIVLGLSLAASTMASSFAGPGVAVANLVLAVAMFGLVLFFPAVVLKFLDVGAAQLMSAVRTRMAGVPGAGRAAAQSAGRRSASTAAGNTRTIGNRSAQTGWTAAGTAAGAATVGASAVAAKAAGAAAAPAKKVMAGGRQFIETAATPGAPSLYVPSAPRPPARRPDVIAGAPVAVPARHLPSRPTYSPPARSGHTPTRNP